jgi:excinuclease ABC subunit B
MAEDLADYLSGLDVRVRYLHSEIAALERVDILRDLRLAEFDVLVGINLLREGLDLPEVSLVIILDADKEGFLRSERSLIQTAGRAARNVGGEVIMYADRITDSMRKAIDETERRRKIQAAYNKEHSITPKSIYKTIDEIMKTTLVADSRGIAAAAKEQGVPYLAQMDREERIEALERAMHEAAARLEYEKAAQYRDELERLRTAK